MFTPTCITLSILAIVINAFIKYQASSKKKDFSITYWLEKNWLDTLLTILVTGAIYLMTDDLIRILGLSINEEEPFFYKAHAFISAFFAKEILYSFIKIMRVRYGLK
jgi:hypothetical protein